MEVGKVDEDRGVGPPLARLGVQALERRAQGRKLFDDFGDAHDREAFRGDHTLQTRLGQSLPSHPEGVQVRPLPPQRREEMRAVQVARGLAGGDEELHEERRELSVEC